jgi:hypothetical protein
LRAAWIDATFPTVKGIEKLCKKISMSAGLDAAVGEERRLSILGAGGEKNENLAIISFSSPTSGRFESTRKTAT